MYWGSGTAVGKLISLPGRQWIAAPMPVSVYMALNIFGSDFFSEKKKSNIHVYPLVVGREGGGGGVADPEVFYPIFFAYH